MTTGSQQFIEALKKEILILDGAMGTMIQTYDLTEEDFRLPELQDHPVLLKGNNDLLCLSRPDIVRSISRQFLEAGAEIIETNSFNSNHVSQADYQLTDWVGRLNYAAASLAREEVDRYMEETGKTCFVAGVLGPTGRTASMSPDVEDPAARNITFDALVETYLMAAKELAAGGVDLFLIETVFDTLNAKAAVYALGELEKESGQEYPYMVSGTITDASGRMLTGQTPEAFYTSLSHRSMTSVGLNCALGADDLIPHLESLSSVASCYISTHPNAGLPDELGNYNHSPEHMAGILEKIARRGLLNIVGGCCGTTPEHIRAIAEAVKPHAPRSLPKTQTKAMALSGLERMVVDSSSLFVNVGERTNVAGSRRFARLIREEKYEEALAVAHDQVENGAQIIDINLDDAMLDAQKEMRHVLNYFLSDPAVARVPFMIDSSKWEVVETGLKSLQGKGIVNSISLKEGEEEFLQRARSCMRYGAAVVVMAFDETGQAETKERKIEICSRAYDLLKNSGFPTEDIIFDPNIFAVGTGMEEHRRYAIDFIEATREIRRRMPETHVSGGVSNISFSFRGMNPVREAMHSSFLYHAIQAGMDMGIVNPAMLQVYSDIDPTLKELVENLLFDRTDTATEDLLTYAQNLSDDTGSTGTTAVDAWREEGIAERLKHALVKGITTYLTDDLSEARKQYASSVEIIEGPLMAGMDHVGELFGAGQMFLPQVVKSARVMKKAVAFLQPYLEEEKVAGSSSSAGKILMATVKGDVHDIGKNIVIIVLQCNNYDVIDMGVMVPNEDILARATAEKVDAIGVSGLITPSLDEMVHLAQEMESREMTIPLFLGGATTSDIHTAVKIDPAYSGPVARMRDASQTPGALSKFLGGEAAAQKKVFKEKYATLRENRKKAGPAQSVSLEQARKNAFVPDFSTYTPTRPQFLKDTQFINIPVTEVAPYIDWRFFLNAWDFKGSLESIMSDPLKSGEAKKLLREAQAFLRVIEGENLLKINGSLAFYPAASKGDDIYLYTGEDRREVLDIVPTLRQQMEKKDRPHLALADFIAPADSGVADYLGFFTVTAGLGQDKAEALYRHDNNDFHAILLSILADRLAEAYAEYLHEQVRKELWGFSPHESLSLEELLRVDYQSIRPAPGYPACPEHSQKEQILSLTRADTIGVHLTESYMMLPSASVCGYFFAHPDARYFSVGTISEEQLNDFSQRSGLSVSYLRSELAKNV
ncbi:methionine synthase [Chitinivibrio alkaliphilus]|uniref:Methionine synthase n=1 Tax=Chitinivibrio alkaliphilus ACht1 TaxID=1313304 RepID=U7DB39_9BACT|nr:methionine synthase [Chitinivibrio alkaliphilus]ERP39247.1 B12-dependent methionine synthase [Chitinivibrio alkaliphilus ACht1]